MGAINNPRVVLVRVCLLATECPYDLRGAIRRVRDVTRDYAVPPERPRFLTHGCRVAPVAVQCERDDRVGGGG